MYLGDNLVTDGANFPFPGHSKDVHFEIELVVALKSGGTNIKAADAAKVAPPAVRSHTSFPSHTGPMVLTMTRRRASVSAASRSAPTAGSSLT